MSNINYSIKLLYYLSSTKEIFSRRIKEIFSRRIKITLNLWYVKFVVLKSHKIPFSPACPLHKESSSKQRTLEMVAILTANPPESEVKPQYP